VGLHPPLQQISVPGVAVRGDLERMERQQTCRTNRRTQIPQCIEAGDRRVVIDLDGRRLRQQRGLQALESIGSRLSACQGQLVLCSLTEPVKLAFSLAGPLGHVVIEPTRTAALQRARQQD
jgi:anti-anti-sigma regulatory factor